MQDEQDGDDNRIIGFILSIAVVVAIAVSFWVAFWGPTIGDTKADSNAQTTLSAPAALVAPAVAAAKPIVEVDVAPALATGADYPTTVSLYFDSGKISLPADTAGQIAKIVEWSKSGPNTKVGLSGYHDKAGDPAQNAALAKNRAFNAREALLSAGTPEDRIIMVKPQSTDGGGPEDKTARRVDIYPAQ
jgi:outer membrane protein OmpA-like peptidoglycan-associated protein